MNTKIEALKDLIKKPKIDKPKEEEKEHNSKPLCISISIKQMEDEIENIGETKNKFKKLRGF